MCFSFQIITHLYASSFYIPPFHGQQFCILLCDFVDFTSPYIIFHQFNSLPPIHSLHTLMNTSTSTRAYTYTVVSHWHSHMHIHVFIPMPIHIPSPKPIHKDWYILLQRNHEWTCTCWYVYKYIYIYCIRNRPRREKTKNWNLLLHIGKQIGLFQQKCSNTHHFCNLPPFWFLVFLSILIDVHAEQFFHDFLWHPISLSEHPSFFLVSSFLCWHFICLTSVFVIKHFLTCLWPGTISGPPFPTPFLFLRCQKMLVFGVWGLRRHTLTSCVCAGINNIPVIVICV